MRGATTLIRGFRRRLPAIFAILVAVEMAASGWHAWYFQDWAMETGVWLLVCWWLVRHHRERPFSNLSYFLLFLFASAHALGAHYTYSQVPYDAWSESLFQMSLTNLFGFSRNHYDRLVHFMFGLLCYLPTRELLRSRVTARGAGSFVLPGTIIVTIATFYELLEWFAVQLFGGDLGQSYLGMQGDIWDSQKDVAVAVIGAAIAGGIVAMSARRKAHLPATVEAVPQHDDRVVYLTKISKRNAKDLVRQMRDAVRRSDQ